MAKEAMAPVGTRESGDLLIQNRLRAPSAPATLGPQWWQTNIAGPAATPPAAPPPYVPPTEAGPYLSPIPTPAANPLASFQFDPSAFTGGGAGGWQSQTGGSFQPGSIDTTGDAGFEQLLRQRMAGEGVGPSWEQIVSGSYDPYSRIIDRETTRMQDQTVEQMISRGVLDSSESARTLADVALEAQDRKNAFLGQLGMEHEKLKQEGINTAISQFGILEGNKLQAKVTITAANIGASAQVQSAAISAGATTQAAMISAQARLQEAGLNASVALETLRQQMDMSLTEQGIDPVLFQSDPAYRGSIFEGMAAMREQERELMRLVQANYRADLAAKASGAYYA